MPIRTISWLLGLAAMLGSGVCMAEDARYVELVARYAEGDREEPSAQLCEWDAKRLELEVMAAATARQSEPFLRAGVLLHTECAARQVGAGEACVRQLRLAEIYVRVRGVKLAIEQVEEPYRNREKHQDPDPLPTTLGQSWYRLAVELARTALRKEAKDLLYEGRLLYPTDPGLVLEEASMLEAPQPEVAVAKARDAMLQQVSGRRRLEKAEKTYTKALELDVALTEARLRRGRVRAQLGQAAAAEEDLSQVLRESAEARLLYLAHLFRGRLLEEAGDHPGAAESYKAAVAAGPPSQAAHMGLARVLELQGERDGFLAAVDGALVARDGIDPWWLYGTGMPIAVDDLRDAFETMARGNP